MSVSGKSAFETGPSAADSTAGERCVRCGGQLDANATCRLVWSGNPPEPDHDAWECAKCTAGDLIARLEAATEGSRELDAAIHEHLGRQNRPKHWCIHADLPYYTTSLDAAMTLVPRGAFVELSISPKGTSCDAEVNLNDGKFLIAGDTVKTSTAATTPLALCIAALKARPTS